MTTTNVNFLCPITQTLMEDPVIGSDGITYERAAIEAWIQSGHRTSPMTREPMYEHSLVPNYALKAMIQESLATVCVQTPVVPDSKPDPIQVTAHSIPGTTKTHIQLFVPETAATMPTLFIDLLDNSGSMGSSSVDVTQKASDAANFSRSDLLRHSVATQIELLRPQDELAVILFDHNATVVLEPTHMTTQGRAKAKTCLPKIQPTGGTAIWAGLQKALTMAAQPEHANKHIVILLQTDGESDASLNPPRGIAATFTNWRDTHPNVQLTLHTVGYGFGSALDMPLLCTLAQIGEGTVNYIPDGSMVGTVFIHLMANLMTCVYRGVRIHIPDHGRCAYMGYLQGGQPRDIVLDLRDGPIGEITVTADNTPDSVSTTVTGTATNYIWPLVHQDLLYSLQSALNAAENSRFACAQKTIFQDLTMLCTIHKQDPSVQAILTDLVDPLTYKGQLGKAFASTEAFQRWGRHYVPSVLSGHMQQWPINFKDEGSKLYGTFTGLTRRMVDRGDEIFNNLPPPTASCNYTPTRAVASMASIHNAFGGCFLGSSRVHMAGGYEKRCDQIYPGERDAAGYIIAKILKIHVPYADVVRLSGPIRPYRAPPAEGGFTPWHPVIPPSDSAEETGATWEFPANLGPIERVATDAVYNFVLEYGPKRESPTPGDNRPGVLIVDGIQACTLAHDMTGPVISHPYFGQRQPGHRNILDDLETSPGWSSGFIEWKHVTETRDPHTGFICGITSE